MKEMLSLISEFESMVKEIHGIYLDNVMGFTLTLNLVEKGQSKVSAEISKSIDELDRLPFAHTTPGPEWERGHTETQGEFKIRMSKGGRNHIFAGNMCIISLYQYWEDHYRSKIAQAMGGDKDALVSPIMGDIRLLRNSIVHHQGIALKAVEEAQVINWFREDDRIEFDRAQIISIMKLVYAYINDLRKLVCTTS